MSWQAAVERTVSGLNYELVDLERSGRGLLRVFIDRIAGQAYPTGESEMVTVADCEAVTRQLHHVLEVEDCRYERLEVSSPGLDRPLKRQADYERFAGQQIELTLKLPLQGRRKYKGTLQLHESGWRVVFEDNKTEQALDFTLDEVREARLVPVLDFKGRRSQQAQMDGGRNA
jgi:ribosome maturation factor RimP